MKIYMNSIRDNSGEHKGYSYFSSKLKAEREAAKLKTDDLEVETTSFEINPRKAGIIAALNNWGGHADNG